MNRFIRLRNQCAEIYSPGSGQSFKEYYLRQQDLSALYNPTDRKSRPIARLFQVQKLHYTRNAPADETLAAFLEDLGQNPYLDRSIIDLLLRSRKAGPLPVTEEAIGKALSQEAQNPEVLFHLLDYAIESGSPLLREEELEGIREGHPQDRFLLRQLVEYVCRFRLVGKKPWLEGLLTQPIHLNLKLLIIDTLISFQETMEEIQDLIRQLRLLTDREANPQIFRTYYSYRGSHLTLAEKTAPLTLVQTMFYGDPQSLGKGDSGGLGILLKNIGNTLEQEPQVDKIITLTLGKKWEDGWQLLEQLRDRHYVFRMPMTLDPEDPTAFVRHQWGIKRSILKAMNTLGISPDIFHVRYLDNASLAVAEAAQEMDGKLVFTLTPDPHRRMFQPQDEPREKTLEEALSLSNKVLMGDELLARAHGVLGIGGLKVRQELRRYFPQLQRQEGFHFQMADEGIITRNFPYRELDLEEYLCRAAGPYALTPEALSRPVILNVGRLTPVKGQDQLLLAWGESRLSEDFTLILIGGDREHPSPEEQAMTGFFRQYLDRRPDLAGRFLHLPAQDNPTVRSLERSLRKRESGPFPDLYLCASRKEEFGISILEAMYEGFLALGPEKGGVRSYISPGDNGFLLDTSSWESIIRDLEEILYEAARPPEAYREIIRKGQEMIQERYAMETVAKAYLAFYQRIKEGTHG